MKKVIYIVLFTFLGILLQFLVHAAIEIPYISLLLSDFGKFGFGLSWETWELIHYVATVVLLFAGAAFGFWQGKYWWHRLYENESLKKK